MYRLTADLKPNRHDADVVRRSITRLIHQQAPEPFAPLKKCLHRRPRDLRTVVDGQTLELYTVGAKGVDVTVVDEVDPVQVYHSQVWGCRFEFVHVYYFVYLFLFLLDFLVSA